MGILNRGGNDFLLSKKTKFLRWSDLNYLKPLRDIVSKIDRSGHYKGKIIMRIILIFLNTQL
jgi:hypothetical protein